MLLQLKLEFGQAHPKLVIFIFYRKNSFNSRLEAECVRNNNKLRFNLQQDVNIFTFNSSNFLLDSLNCHLELVVASPEYGISVFIEEMSLSGSVSSCPDDYLQFSRDILFVTTHASRKYCGIIEHPVSQTVGGVSTITFPATPLSGRVYSEEEDMDMDMWLQVRNIQGRRGNEKFLTLVVTPYRKTCKNNEEFISCVNYASCIKKDLFCDGRVNCPAHIGHLGHPVDEEGCEELDNKEEASGGPGLELLLFFGVISLSFGICCILILKRIKDSSKMRTCSAERQQLEEIVMADNPPQIFPSCPPSLPPPYSCQPNIQEQQRYREPPRYELLWE